MPVYCSDPHSSRVGDGTSTFGRWQSKNGRISGHSFRRRPKRLSLPGGCTIAPGLIDVHTNGARDYLFNRDQGNAVPVAASEYARVGATGFVAWIMTAPLESMLHAASEIVEAANQLEEDIRKARDAWAFISKGRFSIRKFRRIHRAGMAAHATSGPRARDDRCVQRARVFW